MNEAARHLVVLDVPGIKEYVFETERLVEIRGASALLDRLNRIQTEACLQENLGVSQVTRVFANGGGAQFIIEASLEQLHISLTRLKRLFADESRGALRLVHGIAPYVPEAYDEALSEAFVRLNEDKEETSIVTASQIHTGYVRECDSCSEMASDVVAHAGEDLVLCRVCHAKLVEGRDTRRSGLWEEFCSYLRVNGMTEEDIELARPRDFEDIGERCAGRKGYTAVVYADGNAMGKLGRSIRTEGQFRLFAQVVDQSIREACHEAIFATCNRSSDGVIPADILLLGGDDLVVYTTAEAALPLAIDVSERFTRRTRERFEEKRGTDEGNFFRDKLKGEGLTVSSGVAYGKSHTPFSIMLDQAEELLKSAKEAGAREARSRPTEYYAPSYIDYHVASSYNQIRVGDCRARHLQFRREGEPVRLYQKPYSLEDVKLVLQHARALSNIPRSRLQALAAAVGSAPDSGWMNATLDCLKVYGRTRKKEHREALFDALNDFGCASRELPWKMGDDGISTALLDLIEITEFVSPEGRI